MFDARFPRGARLLTPKDYQAVFNDAPFRASVPELLVLSRRNGRDDARIGIIVGKKNCRLANQRNRVKRLCRESFRQQKAELAGLDIIVLARKNVALLDNPTLSNTLSQLWKRVLKKARDPSVGPLNTQQDGC